MIARATLLIALAAHMPLGAAESVFTLDPARTQISFTLSSVLHTVHGSFQLKQGTVRFDPANGQASGEVVVDARSGETGNSGRDSKMHKTVLESAKYPQIVFRPDRIEGAFPAEGSAMLQVHGTFSIHGADHEMTIPIEVQRETDQISATMRFRVPYIQWGMKNPSTLFLRVSDTVDMEVHAIGRLAAQQTRALVH